MNYRKNIFTLLSLFFIVAFLQAQNLKWTGVAGDASFFNENNWVDTGSGNVPISGTIDPGVPINKNLIIESASAVIGGINGVTSEILMGTGNLTIKKSTLKIGSGYGLNMGSPANTLLIDSAVVTAESLKNATLNISGDSKLYLKGNNPFDINSNINITSYDAWIFSPTLNALTANTSYAYRVKDFGNAMVESTNARIVQYYTGCAFVAYSSGLTPLRIYDYQNLEGDYGDVQVYVIKAGLNIPGNLNKRVSSFKLKKGYMATFAVETNGTGMSKVYIASESDLVINTLPPALNDNVSFIRVVPWIWVNKKGTGGNVTGVDGSWYYNWGATANSFIDREYAPMGWGKGSFDTQTEVNALVNKKRVTHVMSFNEADNCEDQSGKFGLLCVVDTAVLYHQNTMKSGLRIVSPSGREGTEQNWLKNMNNLAVPRGIRMDVIGIHWYDWGANPKTTPDEDPAKIFTRFKNKVIACYNYYKMPIWITEFNANLSRNRWVQDGFLELALPWLEQTPYVERYAYFQPNGGNGDFFDTNGNLTSTGTIYFNHVSTPSIKEEQINYYVNNLESRMNTPTSTDDLTTSNREMQVYLNNLNRSLFIGSEKNESFYLINVQGVLLRKFQSNATEDISDLSKGVYILYARGVTPQKILLN
ncbi:MAG: glycosyl hydrolase [Bacteroidales bacterium]